MKKKVLFFALCSFFIFGCNLDDPNDYPAVYYDFATIVNPNLTQRFWLERDNGTRLYTKEIGETAPGQGVPRDGMRVFASYNDLSNNEIRILGFIEVPIDSIKEKSENTRNDSYILYFLSHGKNYLNVLHHYYITPSQTSGHKLSLFKVDYTNADTARLEMLYSNGGDDNGTVRISEAISFDLSSLKEFYHNRDSVRILLNTYARGTDSLKVYNFSYKF